jgi:low temperature requirement protein LtrA
MAIENLQKYLILAYFKILIAIAVFWLYIASQKEAGTHHSK